MPTVVTVTVKPSGGDYTSLSAAEAGEQGDLVAADEQLDIECYAMEDTTRCVFTGWTVDSTRYVRIFTPETERHDGKWDDTAYRYVITSGFSGWFNAFQNDISYTRVEGLQFKAVPDGAVSGRQCVSMSTFGRFSHSIIWLGSSSAISCNGLSMARGGGSGVESWAWNNIIYAESGSGASGGMSTGTGVFGDQQVFYNNTVYGWTEGIVDGPGDATIVAGNVCQSNTTDYTGSFTSKGGNVSEDTSSPDSALRELSVTFVDEGNFDFHLASGDTSARGNGVDLSADGDLAFADDIDGDARSAWDAGADEFVSVGGTNPKGPLSNPFAGPFGGAI